MNIERGCSETGKKENENDQNILGAIESPYNGQRLQSQAHAEFLDVFFGANVRLVNPDGNDEIEIQQYNTSSKVTAKDLLAEIQKHQATK